MFSLSELLDYDDIVIQCHNAPDADSMASAFSIYKYLKANNKNAEIIYAGPQKITKINLSLMKKRLSIPIKYVKDMPYIKTLVLADCQYKEDNVKEFEAEKIFIIDHHQERFSEKPQNIKSNIRSELGSCSTVIWNMLKDENFNFDRNLKVVTALYYGLFTDTNNFDEMSHPEDKEMRDFLELRYNRNIFKELKYNNLSQEELSLASAALIRPKIFNEKWKYAIYEAARCDSNILGYIADLALEITGNDICVIYSELENGIKLSIRSCIREFMTNDFTDIILKGTGKGGGHKQKAGYTIYKDKIMNYETTDIGKFIDKCANEYFEKCEIIHADKHKYDVKNIDKYIKKDISMGCMKSTSLFPKGTPMLIRTLEGDTELESSNGIYLMIGIKGEVYPINAKKFRNKYKMSKNKYDGSLHKYTIVKNRITGTPGNIQDNAKQCFLKDESYIHAMRVTKYTKIFTEWTPDSYLLGMPGDYIAFNADDHSEVYIIKKDIFNKTYEKI